MQVIFEIKTVLDGITVIEKELKIENGEKGTICNLVALACKEYGEAVKIATTNAIKNA